MRAADALMECLKAEGVEVVFGLPGGANLPTYDALYDAGIRHILVRHEAGGGHAAEGYAKATGKVGVAFGTSGPGRDQPRHADHRRDAGLGADGLHHRPGAHRPDRHRRLPGGRHRRHHDADRQALVHDPGPARDPARRSTRPSTWRARAGPAPCSSTSRRTSRGRTSSTSRSTDVHLPGYQPTTEGNQKQIRLAAKALANARRPVIYAGGGVVNANAARGAHRARHSRPLPGHLHLMGLGAFPAPHEQWLGMLGMHGTRAANYAMDEADLIVRDRRALRRPHHRQAVGVRAAGEVHPHRRRPGGDLQERAGAHPDRRRRQEHPAAADSPSTARWRPTPRAWRTGGTRIRELAEAVPAAATRTRPTPRSSRSTWSRRSTRRPAATRSSPPTSASTRCGRRSTSTSPSRGAGSTPAAWARWASACRPRWAPQVGCPDETVVLHRRRRLGADEHAGARDVRRERHPDQGVHHEQRLPRAWSASGRSCSGTSATATSTWASRPDFVKLAEAYGATGMRLDGQDHAGRRHARGDRHRRPGRSSTCASRARRTRIR